MDSKENLGKADQKRIEKGYTWVMYTPVANALDVLNIHSRSNKLAVNAQGEVIYRDSIGKGNAEEWEELFRRLSRS
tara:strand:+ start:556 stop:783 length:228 start_codon:yes stop_codon:yes gene_type:complete